MASIDTKFDQLVRDHARLMASAIRRVCRNRYSTLIPDVEQEVYLALWNRLQTGKKIEHPVSYLYKMALTTALRFVRTSERQPVTVEDGEFLAALQERENPSAERTQVRSLEPPERTLLVQELLASLEEDESRALRAYLAGMGHQEVAELYGWSESVARHRIYRSLERLRKKARAPRNTKP